MRLEIKEIAIMIEIIVIVIVAIILVVSKSSVGNNRITGNSENFRNNVANRGTLANGL